MAEKKQNLQGTPVIAKLFELSERRVQQLAQEGVLPIAKRRPYQFDLLPTIQAYIRYLNGKIRTGGDAESESDKLRAEADLKRSKANIAQMQEKELEGKMHRSEDVEAVFNDLIYTTRSMVLSLPGRLAVDIAQVNTAAEASAMIQGECHKILEELAEYKYDPEEYQRRVQEREGFTALTDGDDD